jgi:alcohol dehydrogenase (cytochrome c)
LGRLLATGGGLVFGGSNEGLFYALDASTGGPLGHLRTGGAIGSNPISFLFGGRQQVAIAAGRSIFVFGL